MCTCTTSNRASIGKLAYFVVFLVLNAYLVLDFYLVNKNNTLFFFVMEVNFCSEKGKLLLRNKNFENNVVLC